MCLFPTAQYRQACYDKLMEAINRSITKCHEQPTKTVTETAEIKLGSADTEEQFKKRVIERYQSPAQAWDVFNGIGDTKDSLTRADFKQIVSSMLGMKITSSEKGRLRKRLDPGNSKLITFSDFISFFAEDTQAASNTVVPSSRLPSLPLDVPQLPDA